MMPASTDGDEFFSDDRTSTRAEAVEYLHGSYRDYLADPLDPTVAQYRGLRYDSYSAERTAPSFVQDLLASWNQLYTEPFRGLTTDGAVLDGIFPLPPAGTSDPTLRRAADRVLDLLDPDQRDRYRYPVDAPEWRAWSNPEFVIHRVGLRLEDLTGAQAEAVLDLVRASLSPEGFAQVGEAMALNGLLGDLLDLPTIMNGRSYWVSLFGTPSDESPWGWQLFGHHVAVNFIIVGGRHVAAPVFLGAEPAVVGDGPGVFAARESAALALVSSLSPGQRAEAVVFDSVLDPAMPPGRLHPADERHVAGAFRDNLVVPYEGIAGSALDAAQRELLLALVDAFLVLLVEPQRRVALELVASHLEETRFAWYGATDESQPFYFRVHGPAVFAELDHHAGVWLTNRLPARFHVHTVLRLPNGNDYGRAYRDQWRDRPKTRPTKSEQATEES
jgi:hypothetical protein